MKNNLIKDIKIAANMFADIRKARKNGNKIEIRKKLEIPLIQSGVGCSFYDTIEGCRFSRLDKKIVDAARMVFKGLSPEEKYKLSSTPKDGEFIERACLWYAMLEPVLTEKECHIAMRCIIEWYIHIKQMRKEGTVA